MNCTVAITKCFLIYALILNVLLHTAQYEGCNLLTRLAEVMFRKIVAELLSLRW